VRSHENCDQLIRLTIGNVVTEMKFFEARTKCLEKFANTLHILLKHIIIEPESAHTGMQLAAQEAMEKSEWSESIAMVRKLWGRAAVNGPSSIGR
jgi:hypothetical protein